jgi:hypothetical protein
VFSSESSPKAELRACWKSSHIFHSGRQSSTIEKAIQVANDSLSHRSSHHSMVTRSPNHMCASSCAITSATRLRSARLMVFGSTSSSVSRNVTAPAFSMAPNSKSGTAIRSSFAYG